jgi:hypothetical protein
MAYAAARLESDFEPRDKAPLLPFVVRTVAVMAAALSAPDLSARVIAQTKRSFWRMSCRYPSGTSSGTSSLGLDI